MSLVKLSSTESVENIVNTIKRDGGVIIRNYLKKNDVNDILNELNRYFEELPSGKDDGFSGNKTKRLGNLFTRLDKMKLIALNPLYLETARTLLQTPIKYWSGENQLECVPDIQIGLSQAIQILPGQTAQSLHRDDSLWLWRHPNYGREARLQIMVAITEFTQKNGATNVIPGSHLWSDDVKPSMSETISAEMEAGDALIWLGSLYHGGGSNTSDNYRIGITMGYDLAFLRQEENAYLTIKQETMKTFPKELQELLGWKMSSTYVGHVEIDGQMSHPIDILEN